MTQEQTETMRKQIIDRIKELNREQLEMFNLFLDNLTQNQPEE
jgi:hypothetical protein